MHNSHVPLPQTCLQLHFLKLALPESSKSGIISRISSSKHPPNTPAGSGFGASLQFVSITAADSDQSLPITALSQTELRFTAPPGNGLSSRVFTLAVNNATQNLTIKYSEAATARVDAVLGSFPVSGGQLVLPSTSAAALTLIGSGFTSTLAAEVVFR